jgi:uncharacterized phiE125 gp8 family phage protein
MMFRPVRTVAPANVFVSLDEVKAHCRVDFDDDDAMLSALTQAATDFLDGWAGILGRCLISQTWRVDVYDWVGDIRMPFPDVQSVTVKYFDADNAEQTVSSSLYELLEDHRGSFVRFLDAFTEPAIYDDRSDAIQITLVAGYGDNISDVPQAIRQAALLLIGHWYESREAGSVKAIKEVPMAVDALTKIYRRVAV